MEPKSKILTQSFYLSYCHVHLYIKKRATDDKMGILCHPCVWLPADTILVKCKFLNVRSRLLAEKNTLQET